MLRVLVADDDPGIVRTLMLGLKMMGCQPVGVESAEAAIKALEDKSADLLLTDMRMEGMSGVDLVRDAHARWPEMICVVMTAFASYENAVSAIKAGAYDYLPKPFTTEQLEHLIRKVEMLVDLQRENSRLRAGSGDWFDGLTSPKCQALQSVVERIAPSDATVLLSGETGSGKTELARSIHRRSARADKPFVEVTCTAIAENLFESEVFGHVPGAFTGAVRDKAGKFELADGGTLFLDEIGELSATAQSKLLRFLEDKVIERVGDNKPIRLDVRIIGRDEPGSCRYDEVRDVPRRSVLQAERIRVYGSAAAGTARGHRAPRRKAPALRFRQVRHAAHPVAGRTPGAAAVRLARQRPGTAERHGTGRAARRRA